MLVVVEELLAQLGHADGVEGQQRRRAGGELRVDLGGDLLGLRPGGCHLAADLPEGLADPAGWSWLAAAAALTGGAGYALWSNRSRPRTGLAAVGPDSVLVRWGEEHDARVR